jgi:hypothetical protein
MTGGALLRSRRRPVVRAERDIYRLVTDVGGLAGDRSWNTPPRTDCYITDGGTNKRTEQDDPDQGSQW